MTNRQKAKGDNYERLVLGLAHAAGFPDATRTRPGRREDQGDIHLAPSDYFKSPVIVQTKDVATPQWRPWADELKQQKVAASADFAFLALKRRGSGGRPALHLAVMELADMFELIHHVHQLETQIDEAS